MKRFFLVQGVAISLIFSFISVSSAQRPADKRAPAKKEDPFFLLPAFTIDQLVDAAGVIAPSRLKEAITRRGIAFTPTMADLDRLRAAGASADVVQLVSNKIPAPPKVPSPKQPPPVLGTLAVRCAPGECEVAQNGKPQGRTDGGNLELRNLPLGDVTIDFKKDGYVSQQILVSIHDAAKVSRSVILVPTAATKEQFGKQLLAQMIEKLGGKEAFTAAANMTAEGNASVWPQGGSQTEWKAIARLKLPLMSYIEISGAKVKWWTSLKGSDSKADGPKQMKGGPVAMEMEKLVRVFRDYQPGLLASRCEGDKVTLSADSNEMDVNGQATFRAAADADSYEISLNSGWLPIRVVHQTATGLGSGLEIGYSDYTADGKIQYPKSISIKYAGQAQHGIELHFGTVNFGAKLSDRDLKW